MMMECPKCGFVQPKDKYCANCGVDVENYKPAKPPIFIRLINSAALQVGLIVIAIASLVVVLMISNRQAPSNIPMPELPTSSDPSPRQPPKAKTQKVVEKALEGSASPKLALTEEAPVAKVGAPETAAVAGKASGPSRLTIQFAEIPNEAIAEILSEGQLLRDEPNLKSVIIANPNFLEQFKVKGKSIRMLPGSDGKKQTVPKAGQAWDVNFTFSENNGAEVGLAIHMVPSRIEEQTVQLDIESQVILPTESSGHTTTEVFGNYTLPQGSVALLIGGIPHRPVPKNFLKQVENTPLQIFSSREFLDNEAEFAIILRWANK